MAWSDVNAILNVFLDDTADADGNYQFGQQLRIDGWNFAQDAFGQHTLLEKTLTPLTIESDGRTVLLPSDFREAAMIYEPVAPYAVYVRREFTPGALRQTAFDELAQTFWGWAGRLHFGTVVTGHTLTLDYWAAWPKVTYTLDAESVPTLVNTTLSVPEWATLPLLHLTTAYCLQPQAIRAALTRNSNIRIDSGTPEDNSRRVQAREHLWWYETLLNKHSPQVRTYGYNV